MRIVLEGVLPLDTKLLLHMLIYDKKYFSLKFFNERVTNFTCIDQTGSRYMIRSTIKMIVFWIDGSQLTYLVLVKLKIFLWLVAIPSCGFNYSPQQELTLIYFHTTYRSYLINPLFCQHTYIPHTFLGDNKLYITMCSYVIK